MAKNPDICDYEGSTYRTDFWEQGGREYEELAERIALKKLLPKAGGRLVDIGAGFGRLADLYEGYDEVVLLDYSKSMLREAQARLSHDFIYVAADLYHLPLADGHFDTAVTVRVLHHVQDIPAALKGIRRVMQPGGTYILEYANKRHLKAILRYLLGRQDGNPFSPEPLEFVELNYDFHPSYMEAHLQEAGFAIERQLAVSYLRLPLLKRWIAPRHLAALDGWLQGTAALCKLSPSVFIRARAAEKTSGMAAPKEQGLFRCPLCQSTNLAERPQYLTCRDCGRRWAIDDGIYDFREPI